MSRNSCLINFVQFSNCLQWEGEQSFVFSRGQRWLSLHFSFLCFVHYFLGHLCDHSWVSPAFPKQSCQCSSLWFFFFFPMNYIWIYYVCYDFKIYIWLLIASIFFIFFLLLAFGLLSNTSLIGKFNFLFSFLVKSFSWS